MANVIPLEGKLKGPSLEPLLSLCADDMARVDREIVARMRSPVIRALNECGALLKPWM